MAATDESKRKCIYCDANGVLCNQPPFEDQAYCELHLKHLTTTHVQGALLAIISTQLCIEPKDIAPNANLFDHLGADSLNLVELAMECEETFEIEIPDEAANAIQTLNDALTYITNTLFEKGAFITASLSNLPAARRRLHESAERSETVLRTVVRSPTITGLCARFGIPIETFASLFLKVLRSQWISHVTTVPELTEGAIVGTYLFVLTGSEVVLFYLQPGKAYVDVIPLKELHLSSKMSFDGGGEVASVEIVPKVPDYRLPAFRRQEGLLELEFKDKEGVRGALNFVAKAQRNLSLLQ